MYGLDDPVAAIQITTTQKLENLETVDESDVNAENDNSASDSTDESSEAESALSEETASEQDDASSEASDESTSDVYTYELQLGDFSTMDSQRYISVGDGKVYLVSGDPLDVYSVGIEDMLRRDDTLTYDQVSEIRFSGADNYTIVYDEDSTNSCNAYDVYFTEQNDETVPLDSGKVESYLTAVSSQDFTDYVSYNVSDEELADYGLDDPELTVAIDYSYTGEDDDNTVSDTYTMQISRNREQVEEAAAAAEKAEEKGDDDYEAEEVPAYIRIGDSKIIYEVTASAYDTLIAASYDDLRHSEVFNADFDDVTQVDITLDGTSCTLTSQASENDEDPAVWYYGEEEVTMDDFQNALTSLSATIFTDKEASDKEEISLVLHLNNENFPQIEIQFYRYDGYNCLAVVDGESFALVSRSSVVDLIEAVNSIILN